MCRGCREPPHPAVTRDGCQTNKLCMLSNAGLLATICAELAFSTQLIDCASQTGEPAARSCAHLARRDLPHAGMSAKGGEEPSAVLEARLLRRRSDALASVAAFAVAVLCAAAVTSRWCGGFTRLWGPPLHRVPVPPPLPPIRPAVTSSLAEWQAEPQRTFRTRQSRCSIHADGTSAVRSPACFSTRRLVCFTQLAK